jgi:hypothetical protein
MAWNLLSCFSATVQVDVDDPFNPCVKEIAFEFLLISSLQTQFL